MRAVLLAWIRFDWGRSGWVWCVLVVLDLFWLSAFSNYKSVNSGFLVFILRVVSI